MTNKAYIVANEQQERELLEKFEREGVVWSSGEKPTEFIPIKHTAYGAAFPYALINRGYVAWANLFQLKEDIEIVYDGRKEEQMSDKYVVSQEFMNSLNEWRENLSDFSMSENFVGPTAIDELDDIVDGWWNITDLSGKEQNSRLIAILSWVNGEDVFEVEKPKKWVVRSKETDSTGDYVYVAINEYNIMYNAFHLKNATKFDTKEEAEGWANSHQEVIEVEE